MDRYIGKLLDNRYEIQEVIGTGGMAVVYKALCHRLNRQVAVKILKDELFQDAEFRRRFHAESQAVAMLSHPNIVSVYDVSHTEDEDYIVMELIDGVTLKQYLEEKKLLNWREALHYGTQICKALEHAHSRGIIHRDIKPHNIMMLKDGTVKVADFGIARITSSQNTLTREALGSVHYISPEQAKGGKTDCRSDLYSLGVVLYEMLTGKTPFDGDSPVSVAIQHISARPMLPREVNSAIPEGLEQITMRAMEPDVSARYPSASQMLQDLESFRVDPSAHFHPDAVDQTDVPHKVPEQAKKERLRNERKKTGNRRAVLAGFICILLAVVGFVALLVYLMGDTFEKEEDVTVPDLYMEHVEDLKNRYGEDFIIQIDEWIPDDTVGYGLVLSQDPAADMTVKKGAEIRVVVSQGIQQFNMPNLVNYELREAESILDDYELNVEISYENSDIYVLDHVIRTSPEHGNLLSKGQTVTLFVSQGVDKDLIPVPELIGLDLEEAIARLDALSLEVGNVKEVESDLPNGTVTFQSVKQGEQVKKGTIINLQVAFREEKAPQVPVIAVQPSSITVEMNEIAALAVNATVSDAGDVSYEWFQAVGGDTTNLQSVGTGATLQLDTGKPGMYNYCCKITNTLGDAEVSIYTNMVAVTVKQKISPVLKTLDVTLPGGEGPARIEIKMDGQTYKTPFNADRTAGTIQIAVEATGTHVIDIYVDGVLTISRTVEFTAQ